jgi:DNA primase
VLQVLDGALPLIEAIWEFAVAGRTLSTPEQRAALWAELDGQIRMIGDGQVQSLYRVELRRRFDGLFMAVRTFDRRGGTKGRLKPFAVPGPRPPPVHDGMLLEARILLALMINHPFLFEELGEIFAEMELPVAWEPLRRSVFSRLAEEPLDANALGVHLKASGLGPLLDDIAGPRTIEHARFVRPDASADEVRAGWRDVWLRVYRRGLDRELAATRADPARGDDQALERISSLGVRRAEAGMGAEDEQEIATDDGIGLARAIAEALKMPARDHPIDDAGGYLN